MTELDTFEEMEDQEPMCFNDVSLEENPIMLEEKTVMNLTRACLGKVHKHDRPCREKECE
ncbi:hypothetical protein QJS10_CPA03g01389 [Acorus calamus]|uniref:Uncharacterized protein n=1 Tax=Acorus calamus TaxID=4465 RepID=A0AAV9F6L3_ACOCL|nr:hypothetical protein QJS10_CPA03g01389 [Acorus calamus]